MPDDFVIEARLSDEEQDLLAAARRFRETVVAPQAAAWERARAVPREAIVEAARLGLTGIEVPRALGGQGAGFLAKLLIVEELAKSCFAFAFSLVNTANIAARLARDGTPRQIERHLPALLAGASTGGTALTEPHAGSDFPAITTEARRTRDGWVLDGEKAWMTNAATAVVATVYAKTEGGGSDSIAAFLVDAATPGFERLPAYDLMGGHAIGVGGFRLRAVHVAEDAMLYPPGSAFKRALTSINGARIYVAGMCCGMVAEALRITVGYGAERQTFGKRLLDHQGLRWSLVEAATDLEAARLLTYRAATILAAGGNAMIPAAFAKKFAVRMAQQRLGDCLQIMGAEGLREDYPFGRHIACARIAGFVDGSTEIQNERLGAALEQLYR